MKKRFSSNEGFSTRGVVDFEYWLRKRQHITTDWRWCSNPFINTPIDDMNLGRMNNYEPAIPDPSTVHFKEPLPTITVPRNVLDITGERYGHLTVVGLHVVSKQPIWQVKCDCGDYELRLQRTFVKIPALFHRICSHCKAEYTDYQNDFHYLFGAYPNEVIGGGDDLLITYMMDRKAQELRS